MLPVWGTPRACEGGEGARMAGPLRAAFKGYVALRLLTFQGLVVQWYNPLLLIAVRGFEPD